MRRGGDGWDGHVAAESADLIPRELAPFLDPFIILVSPIGEFSELLFPPLWLTLTIFQDIS